MNYQIEENETGKVVYFAELLDKAHQNGLKCIKTSIIQFPTMENGFNCLHHATVETDKGCFDGTGDANPENVDESFSPHYIRISETRSIARALRFALNISLVAVEELGGQGFQRSALPRSQLQPNQERKTSVAVFPGFQQATDRQNKAIYGIYKSLKLDKGQVEGLCKQLFDCSLEQLSKSQASQLIDHMKGLQNGNQSA